jgi:hypothetical protein
MVTNPNTLSKIGIFAVIYLFSCMLHVLDVKLTAQEYSVNFEWKDPVEYSLGTYKKQKLAHFNNAGYDFDRSFMPFFYKIYDLKAGARQGQVDVIVLEERYEAVPVQELSLLDKDLPSAPIIEAFVGLERKQAKASVRIYPFRQVSGVAERLVSIRFRLNANFNAKTATGIQTYADNSVLSNGEWFRVGVTGSGVFRITKTYLDAIGFNSSIDPRTIKIYGNGGRMLPENSANERPDDLIENAIFIQGEQDGVFNDNDFILFYAQGPTVWDYNESSQMYLHQVNIYADTSYYYITHSQGQGKRIENVASSSQTPNITINSFDDYTFIEQDSENLIKSGREWFGHRMEVQNSHTFNFSFPNLVAGTQVRMRAVIAGRHSSSINFRLSSGNTTIGNVSTQPVNLNDYIGEFARLGSDVFNFNASSSFPITVTRQGAGVGWIDKINLNARRNLSFTGASMHFRSRESFGFFSRYVLSNCPSDVQVWEISDIYNVKRRQGTLSGNQFEFVSDGSIHREFIALSTGASIPAPVFAGRINNQNLHGLPQTDYIIVSPGQFLSEANRLANFHRNNSDLHVTVVTPQQIYHEFSSGKQDIAAIRNFVKMFYDRAAGDEGAPKYLLLFGDASIDFKNRLQNNTNFVPSMQSVNSLAPISSFVTDDFYGLLDDGEGNISLSNVSITTGTSLIDIGIGRFVISTLEQAQQTVNKTIHYSLSRESLGDWRNLICLVADDEDFNTHVIQAEGHVPNINNRYPIANIDKIYLDAYQQVSGAGGQRYPDVNDEINRKMKRGWLIWNYIGHGGELGLALERIITIPEINAWNNINNMPFFLTATCEFTRFDNPGLTSAGELVFLNPNGAGVALLTTTRLVYSSPNAQLNNSFYENVFTRQNGRFIPIGEVCRRSKNAVIHSTNNKSFSLVGDPALRLAFPMHTVKTTTMNNEPFANLGDTLKALSKVTINGILTDQAGNKLTSYNGVVIPTVFDKPITLRTLGQDPNSFERNFDIQRNVIYRGQASVVNGDFSFTFVVPKDIRFEYGEGKISYYAYHNNNLEDAAGADPITVGGLSDNPIVDNEGPEIRLYMNDETFVFGGTTDENPDMLAFIYDESGINTVGTGIGHDITAVLDNNTDRTIVLNDFYVADLDDYTRGTIRYPFFNLEEGRHNLRLRVWDVANNSSEAYTEFIVVKSAELALNHVLNYPNPFTTNTDFYFEHNQPGMPLDVQIQVFTVSGKIVKTLETTFQNSTARSTPINWDGRDEFGDKLGRGVYVYRVKVRSGDGKTAEKFEKLVILK